MKEYHEEPRFTADQLQSMQVGKEALAYVRERVGDLEAIWEEEDGTPMGVADDYETVDGHERMTRVAYWDSDCEPDIIGETEQGSDEHKYIFGENWPEEYHGLPVKMQGEIFEMRDLEDTNVTEKRTTFYEISDPVHEGDVVLVREVYGDPATKSVVDFLPISPELKTLVENRADQLSLLQPTTEGGESLFDEIGGEPVLYCMPTKLIDGPRVLSGAEAEEVLGYIHSSVEAALSQEVAEHLGADPSDNSNDQQ